MGRRGAAQAGGSLSCSAAAPRPSKRRRRAPAASRRALNATPPSLPPAPPRRRQKRRPARTHKHTHTHIHQNRAARSRRRRSGACCPRSWRAFFRTMSTKSSQRRWRRSSTTCRVRRGRRRRAAAGGRALMFFVLGGRGLVVSLLAARPRARGRCLVKPPPFKQQLASCTRALHPLTQTHTPARRRRPKTKCMRARARVDGRLAWRDLLSGFWGGFSERAQEIVDGVSMTQARVLGDGEGWPCAKT